MSLYSAIDLPHHPGNHPFWQESWVLVFRDPDTGLVGFLRTGSYVNQKTTQTHWGMAFPDGTRFRRHLLDRPGQFRNDAIHDSRYGILSLRGVRRRCGSGPAHL